MTAVTDRSGMKVVTVSATYGAGGSVVAPKVAELLGLAFFDRIIHTARPASVESIIERLSAEEQQRQAPVGRLIAGLTHLGSGLGLPTPSADEVDSRRQLRAQVEHSVRRISETGGVILGRAAAVVLADHPASFHVRLTGPVSRRVEQGARIEGLPAEAARAHQVASDRAWSRFVGRVFDRDAADVSLYHLILDTTAISLAQSAELIASAANAFWRPMASWLSQ